MAFQFCSPGLVDDFDTVYGMIQNVSGGRDNNPSITANMGAWVRKIVPSATEYWAAVYVKPTDVNTYEFIHMRSGNTNLGTCYCNGGRIKILTNSTVVATSVYTVTANTPFMLEFHFKRDAVNGIAEIFINGVLDGQFIGNTGASGSVDNVFFYAGANAISTTLSNMIIQDTGRIRDMRVAFLTPTTSGDLNDFSAVEVAGHFAHSVSTYLTANSSTYILDNPVIAAGSISQIQMNVYATGTIKIALFNLVGANTFTVKADSLRTIAVTSTGINIFYPGTDFAALNVAAGDYLGFYGDATLKLQQSDSSGYLYPEWYIVGDWTACSNKSFGAQETRSAAIGALYDITDPAPIGSTIVTPTTTMILTNGVVDLGYIHANTNDFKFLSNMTDVVSTSIETIQFLQVTARARYEGVSAVQNIQLALKTNGSLYNSDTKTLSTAFTPRSNSWNVSPFTGEKWTAVDVNNLQVGVVAKT